jgi:hypothetical protein
MSRAAPSRMVIRSAQPEPCSRRGSFTPCDVMVSSAASSRCASAVAKASRLPSRHWRSQLEVVPVHAWMDRIHARGHRRRDRGAPSAHVHGHVHTGRASPFDSALAGSFDRCHSRVGRTVSLWTKRTKLRGTRRQESRNLLACAVQSWPTASVQLKARSVASPANQARVGPLSGPSLNCTDADTDPRTAAHDRPRPDRQGVTAVRCRT